MKRGLAWALALAMMLALLAGCGGSTGGETTASSDVSVSETASSAPMEDAGGSWGAWTDEAPSAEAGETDPDGRGPAPGGQNDLHRPHGGGDHGL